MPHVHDKYDFTVEVFIVNKDAVLLRYHDKYNIWLSVGGHVELDEDPNAAAVREVKEEVGLDVQLYRPNGLLEYVTESHQELIPPMFMNVHDISPTHKHISMSYFATSTSREVIPEYSQDRSDAWKWVTKDELKGMQLKPHVFFYASKALETLSRN